MTYYNHRYKGVDTIIYNSMENSQFLSFHSMLYIYATCMFLYSFGLVQLIRTVGKKKSIVKQSSGLKVMFSAIVCSIAKCTFSLSLKGKQI